VATTITLRLRRATAANGTERTRAAMETMDVRRQIVDRSAAWS
jgi:hypothetical protein